MDMDIEFGELEEAKPEVHLRPDLNKHFVVVPVQDPEDQDLPIYVDIDVMRDMEAHAQTDKTVELGGVMLGGQFEDEDGNKFVLISDSLRAEHYEATKGSFKFTHETWEKISRQRDEFPDDVQMVGWYHTHPDWGVFLSGMDMFICDNFFNRPLDLALVIDPCRDDRGWFMWTGDPSKRVRRTGGFYLYGSRFRVQEIQYFANVLKGGNPMAIDQRYSPIAGQVGPQGAPVVNILDSRNQAQTTVIFGMLAMQFLLLMLLAWKILVPFEGAAKAEQDDKMAKIEERLSEMSSTQLLAAKNEGQQEARENIVAALTGSKDIAADYETNLEELRLKRRETQALAYMNLSLDKKLKRNSTTISRYRKDKEKLIAEKGKLSKEKSALSKKLKAAEETLDELGPDGTGKPFYQDKYVWIFGGLIALIAGMVGYGGAVAAARMREEEYEDEIEDKKELEENAFNFGDVKSEGSDDEEDDN